MKLLDFYCKNCNYEQEYFYIENEKIFCPKCNNEMVKKFPVINVKIPGESYNAKDYGKIIQEKNEILKKKYKE